MKKKYPSLTRTGLPHLAADDLSFGRDGGEKTSFAESFDPELFDREAKKFLSRREKERRKARKYPDKRGRKQKEAQSELDLHGCIGREVGTRIADFIRKVRERGLVSVRIITGRGLHSQGPAVLPDVAEQKLRELKEQGLINGYQWDKGDKAASGAILAWL